jgi:hypothetical protein
VITEDIDPFWTLGDSAVHRKIVAEGHHRYSQSALASWERRRNPLSRHSAEHAHDVRPPPLTECAASESEAA